MDDASLYRAAHRREPAWLAVAGYYDRTWYDYNMQAHGHLNVELMYVFSGECVIDVYAGGGAPARERLHAGEFVFLDANVRHTLVTQAESPCAMLNVELRVIPADGALFTLGGLARESESFARFVGAARPYARATDRTGELFRALDLLISDLSRPASLTERCARDAKLQLLLIQTARAVDAARALPAAQRHVRRAAMYIQRRYADPITLADVAGAAGVSADHLGRVFREATGETVNAYITRTRLDHAGTLLERSALSVLEVALQTGFHSAQHFGQRFRAQFGMSPSRYRARHRKWRRGGDIALHFPSPTPIMDTREE